MEGTDAATAVLWAFSAPAAEGVPVLESIASRFAPFDRIPLDDAAFKQPVKADPSLQARELMSLLVSCAPPFASPAQLSLYVVLVSRVYAALFLETLARRRCILQGEVFAKPTDASDTLQAQVSAEEVLAGARVTMRAWSRDVSSLFIDAILPQLCCRDAQAQTVSTSATAASAAPVQAATTQEDETQAARAQETLLGALEAYRVPQALARLLKCIYCITSDDTVCPLLVTVYATLYHMESCPCGQPAEQQRSTVTPALEAWRARFLREVEGVPSAAVSEITSKESRGEDAEASGEKPALSACLAEATAEVYALFDAIVTSLKMPGCPDVFSFTLVSLEATGFPSLSDNTMFASELERGAGPPDSTAAALVRERDAAIDAFTVVATDDVDAVEESAQETEWDPKTTPESVLYRQGILFLLVDNLRATAGAAEPPLYTASSASVLLCTTEVCATALTTTGAAPLMRHLLFLHDVLSTVPKCSLTCVAEGAVSPRQDGAVFDVCTTRRYEAFFTLARELLSVSALCPLEELRRMARVLALEVLERLQEEPRVRMHLSLLSLCPYPSIARFFLERLLEDWREQVPSSPPPGQADVVYAASTSPVASLVPLGLMECVSSFLHHLTAGTRGYVDPLIVSLNFVRVEASRRAWIRKVAAEGKTRKLDGGDGRPSSALTSQQAWGKLLGALRHDILPRCKALVGPPPNASSDAAAAFALPSLSPLDIFSLSSAVEGVEALLP